MSGDQKPGGGPIDLGEEDRAAIDHYQGRLLTATHYELLGVARDADRKTIRDAYFALSRRFHPDVFYKRELGPYKPRINEIFHAFTRAYDVLSNARQRAGYDLHLASLQSEPPSGISSVPPPPRAPTPAATSTPVRAPTPAPVPSNPSQPAVSRAPTPTQPFTPRAPTPTHGFSPRAPTPPPMQPPGARAQTPTPFAAGSPPSTGSSQSVRELAREGVVVPPSLRSIVEVSGPRSATPRAPSESSSNVPIDPAARQRAMEAMARRLGGNRNAGASSRPSHAPPESPARPSAQQIADERASRVAQLITQAEEAQKKGDLDAALESYRKAAQFAREDTSIKARIDAVNQLVQTRKTSEYIEKAREAQKKGDAENAANYWEKAWEGRPTDAALLLNAAEVLAKYSKDHKRAADFANRALQIDARLFRAHVVLATVFLAAGLRASARGAIENAAKLEPENPALKELRDKLGPMSIAEQFGLRGR
jgi:Tfp pilus assembly protein PilF